jgi:hypothetical protein
MPIPTQYGDVRHPSSSEDQEYNTKLTGGEVWKELSQKYNTEDPGGLWRDLAADEYYFVGVPEDEAKGYLTSIYGYDFKYKY